MSRAIFRGPRCARVGLVFTSELDIPDDMLEAAQLARTLVPDMTDIEMQQALLERLCSNDEIIESVFEDVVNDDSIGDCLREQDRRAMKEHLQSKQKAKAKRLEHSKSIQNYMKWEATTKRIHNPFMYDQQLLTQMAVSTLLSSIAPDNEKWTPLHWNHPLPWRQGSRQGHQLMSPIPQGAPPESGSLDNARRP